MASTASSSYADAKVLFVSNNLGDSLSRVNAISSTSIATYALFAATIRLLAAQERHDAAGASRRQQQQQPSFSQATAHLHALRRLYRQARSSSLTNRQARFTVTAVEFGAIVVPLLLSITVSSSTGAALTLSASLSLVAAAFYRQARLLEAKAPSPAVARKSSVNGKGKAVASDDEDDDEIAEETSALRSQSSYSNARPDSEQRRRAATAARRRDSDDDVANNGDEDSSVDNRAAAAARRRKRRQRSHWESDDEEQELEEIERLESVKVARAVQRPTDDEEGEGGGFRVSIESAADQAYGEAHPPEAWVEPGARPEEDEHGHGSRASSPSPHGRIPSADGRSSPGPNRSASSSRNNRRGLGLGLGLGLVPPRQNSSPTNTSSNSRPLSSHNHDGFLTVYRSHMMLITVACILAVDFPLFPRVLGKCETWGASLMDLGVGSFVFSLGLVGAGAQLRQQENEARSPVKARGKAALRTLIGALRKDMGKCLPLLALGLVRALSVRLTDYPEHITEYGAHWSFFLTLSALPPLKTLVGALRSSFFGGKGRWSTWGLAIAAAHQAMLRWGGVQRFVLDEEARIERTSSLLAANREGICSLPGYLAIMLLATDLGLYVLPKVDPYQAFRKVKLSKAGGARGSDEDEDDEDDVDAHADKAAIAPTPLYGHARTGSDGRIDIKAALTSARRVQSKRLSSLCAILASWAVIYWAALAVSAWALSALLDDGHGGRAASPSIVAPWRGYGPEAALRSPAASASTTSSGIVLVGSTNLLTRVISRRLANAPYVLWVAAFNASFLAAYACVYRGVLLDVEYAPPVAFRRGHQRGSSSSNLSRGARADEGIEATSPASLSSSPTSSSFDSPYSSTFTGRPATFGDLHNNDDSLQAQALQQQQHLPTTPLLLSSINTHSLRIFLVANLLTGVVNLSMKTMHASAFTAALVLTGYLAAVVGVAVGLDELGLMEEEEQGRGRGFAAAGGKGWVRWVKGLATGRRRGR